MTGFLIKTLFYTAGVVGFLFIAYIVAKNSMNGAIVFKKKQGNLEIEETLSISPRKTLHIVKAFNEKFLIASDANSTTLLAKLNSNNELEEDNKKEVVEEFSSLLEDTKFEPPTPENKSGSVIQSMLNRLK